MSKNAAVLYKGVKINIIDTPGHTDFSGEVERIISMADGCLLLVDSVEGPMPQTKFVLRLALQGGLKTIIVINKTDRPNARIDEVISLVHDLFLELATSADQLDFHILYASAKEGIAATAPDIPGRDISPIFDCILANVPPPKMESGPFQMLVSNLDYDSHKGQIAIGRILRGKVAPRNTVVSLNADGNMNFHEIAEVFTYLGLKRLKVDRAEAGDIVAVTGIEKVSIGDTIADSKQPSVLPRIEIGEPTVEVASSRDRPPVVEKNFDRAPISNPTEDEQALLDQALERILKEIAGYQMG